MKGITIRRSSKVNYEIEEGSYSNCNTDLRRDKDVGDCHLDWRVYGRRISIEVEGYAHIHDAILYAKDMPLFYTPYLIDPVKSERQTGILWPRFLSTQTLGSGFSVPLFINLGPWHDLTVVPTYYSLVGYHLRLAYRYVYDSGKRGYLIFTEIQRRLNDVSQHSSSRSEPQIPWARRRRGYFRRQSLPYASGKSFSRRDHKARDQPVLHLRSRHRR